MDDKEYQEFKANAGITSDSKPKSAPTKDYDEFKAKAGIIETPKVGLGNIGNAPIFGYSKFGEDTTLDPNREQKLKAYKQSSLDQLGNSLAKFIPNTAATIVGNIASSLDFEDYANTDSEVGNWLTNATENFKAAVGKQFPIYRTEPNKPLDIGDSGYWFQNGSDLAESAVAFVGSGALTGAGLIKVIGSGAKAAKWLSTMGKTAQLGDTGKKIAQGVGVVSNAVMLNQAESIGIATSVYKETEDYLKAQVDENGQPLYTTPEIKQQAADAAAKSINVNRTNILLNLTSAGALLRTPQLTRQLIKDVSYKNTLKHVGLEGLQEATEEGINLIGEKAGIAAGKGINYDLLDDGVKDLFTKEGLEATLLGAIGGAGQTALTATGNATKYNPTTRVAKRDEAGNIIGYISANQAKRDKYNIQQDIIKQNEEITKSKNATDVTDAFENTSNVLNILENIEEAKKQGDTRRVNDLTNKMVSYQAFKNFQSGTTESLLNSYRHFAALTPEQAKERGLNISPDSPDYYITKANETIKKIQDLEVEYNNSLEYVNPFEVYSNRDHAVSLSQANTEYTKHKADIYSKINAGFLKIQELTPELFKYTDKDNREQTLNYSPTIKRTEFIDENEKKAWESVDNKFKSTIPLISEFEETNKALENIGKNILLNEQEYSKLISPEYQVSYLKETNKKKSEIEIDLKKQEFETFKNQFETNFAESKASDIEQYITEIEQSNLKGNKTIREFLNTELSKAKLAESKKVAETEIVKPAPPGPAPTLKSAPQPNSVTNPNEYKQVFTHPRTGESREQVFTYKPVQNPSKLYDVARVSKLFKDANKEEDGSFQEKEIPTKYFETLLTSLNLSVDEVTPVKKQLEDLRQHIANILIERQGGKTVESGNTLDSKKEALKKKLENYNSEFNNKKVKYAKNEEQAKNQYQTKVNAALEIYNDLISLLKDENKLKDDKSISLIQTLDYLNKTFGLEVFKDFHEVIASSYEIIRGSRLNNEEAGAYKNFVDQVISRDNIPETFEITRTKSINIATPQLYNLRITEEGDRYVNARDRDEINFILNTLKEGDSVVVYVDKESGDFYTKNKDDKGNIPIKLEVENTKIGYFNEQRYLQKEVNMFETVMNNFQYINEEVYDNFYKLDNNLFSAQEIVKAQELLSKNKLFKDILKVDIKSDTSFIKHFKQVLYFNKNLTSKEVEIEFNKEELKNSIGNWLSKLKNDSLNSSIARDIIGTNDTIKLQTKVTKKTSGSIVISKNKEGNIVYRNLTDTIGEIDDIILASPNSKLDATGQNLYSLTGETLPSIPERTNGFEFGRVYTGVKTARINSEGVQSTLYRGLVNNTLTSKISGDLDNEINNYVFDRILELYDMLKEGKYHKTHKEFDDLIDDLRSLIIINDKDTKQLFFNYSSKSEDKEGYINFMSGKNNVILFTDGNLRVDGKIIATETDKQALNGNLHDLIGGLQRNANKKLLKSKNSFTFNGKEYKSYKHFLIETNGLITDIGKLVDNQGKKISNVEAKGEIGLVIEISNDFKKIGEESFNLEENLGDKYKFVIDLAKDLNIKTDLTNTKTIAEYRIEDKTVKLNKPYFELSKYDKERYLVHEILHHYLNGKIGENEKKRLKAFIKELPKTDLPWINDVLAIIKDDVEELITYAFTNPLFAQWLSEQKSDRKVSTSETLWNKLKGIIKDVFKSIEGNKLDELNSLLDNMIEGVKESEMIGAIVTPKKFKKSKRVFVPSDINLTPVENSSQTTDITKINEKIDDNTEKNC